MKNPAHKFDIILRNEPAENAPYLTKTGIALFFLLMTCTISAIVLWQRMVEDASIFAAAAASAIAFMFAVDHTTAIITWRALKKKRITFNPVTPEASCEENTDIRVSLAVRNPTIVALRILALRWAHTDNIQIRDHHIAPNIAPQSECELVFPASTVHAGRGAILGLGMVIASPLAFFRSEMHFEYQKDIPVVPHALVRRSASKYADNILGLVSSHLRCQDCDADIESIRPYAAGDPVKLMAWRYFAKTNSLQTWQFSKQNDRNLVCLLDAGVQMRLPRPDRTSNLGTAVSRLAHCAGMFSQVTIITYDEHKAAFAAKSVQPTRLPQILKAWILDVLEWQPPAPYDKDRKTHWNNAAAQLYDDFRLYKHVDFSKIDGQKKKVDLEALVNWAKTDDALRAFKQNKPEAAQRIVSAKYHDMLIQLIRRRCRMPQPSLMPNPPMSKLGSAVEMLTKVAKTQDVQLLWFSDFAMPVTGNAVEKLASLLRKKHIPTLAMCMPMPNHAMNFIESHGKACRAHYIDKLGKYVDFADAERKMP